MFASPVPAQEKPPIRIRCHVEVIPQLAKILFRGWLMKIMLFYLAPFVRFTA
jgi:hypothetical protein